MECRRMITERWQKMRPRKLFRDELGQAMVEAAMTILLLFVFIFAIWEAGRMLQVKQTLTNATREGARRAVLPLTQTLPGTLPGQADVCGVVQSYLEAASIHSIPCACPSNNSICVDPAVPIGTTTFTKVTVSYPYRVMTILMFGNLNMTLTGQSLMRNETSP
jgi:Flp pilus assembly protein TadG